MVAATASAGAAPSANFTASPSTARIDSPVTLTASVTANGSAIASMRWDFGDGTSAAFSTGGYTVGHTYRTSAPRTVRLTATDDTGASATATQPVTVVGLPTASFTAPAGVPDVGAAVAFDGSASSDPAGGLTYAWDFGDGSARTTGTATPTHTYATGGNKTVSLTVTATFDSKEATFSRVIAVNAPPRAALGYAAVDAFTGQDPLRPLIGQRVAFTAEGSSDADGSIAGYAWDLGSGTFGAMTTAPQLVTTFGSAGARTVRLRVTDDRGATATTTVPVQVDDPAAVASTFVLSTLSAAAPTARAKTALRALPGVRVQLTGSVRAGRTRVTRMVVRARAGVLVVVRCEGPGCPRRDVRMRMGAVRSLRVKALEHTLHAGARIVVTVSKPGFVGRRFILTTRRGRAPARRAGCTPTAGGGANKLGPCPRP